MIINWKVIGYHNLMITNLEQSTTQFLGISYIPGPCKGLVLLKF